MIQIKSFSDYKTPDFQIDVFLRFVVISVQPSYFISQLKVFRNQLKVCIKSKSYLAWVIELDIIER